MALRAGSRVDSALAAAAMAGHHVHEAAKHRLLNAPDLAGASARRALDRAGARLGAVPAAARAGDRARNLEHLLDAEDGLLEGQAQVVAEIGAAGVATRGLSLIHISEPTR